MLYTADDRMLGFKNITETSAIISAQKFGHGKNYLQIRVTVFYLTFSVVEQDIIYSACFLALCFQFPGTAFVLLSDLKNTSVQCLFLSQL